MRETVVDWGTARGIENGTLFNQIAKFAHFTLQLRGHLFSWWGARHKLKIVLKVLSCKNGAFFENSPLISCTWSSAHLSSFVWYQHRLVYLFSHTESRCLGWNAIVEFRRRRVESFDLEICPKVSIWRLIHRRSTDLVILHQLQHMIISTSWQHNFSCGKLGISIRTSFFNFL